MNFPLYVIMSLLGLPESDFPRMLTLTQELFGGDDEEYKRGTTLEEQLQVLLGFFAYFNALTASRREHPTEDLASAIANARIDGEPLSDVDTASYYVIIATAGHDTTKDAISGGLLALIEHAGELTRVRQNPELLRCRASAQQAPGLWLRGAFLSRRSARTHGDEQPVQRAATPA
jgi:cytochrome P450